MLSRWSLSGLLLLAAACGQVTGDEPGEPIGATVN